jgi:membrane protein implicated in regulation of membrane protease activity
VNKTFVAKAWLAGAGLVSGLAGMAWERRWLVWIAVALLSVAFLLRFVDRKSAAP